MHTKPKLIPSYGGWIRIRGIPFHALNMFAFTQIGEARGGFIEATREAVDKMELIKALINVQDNYTGFISANIRIFDEEECEYNVHTVINTEGKWLRERNPRIHGSFTRKAAENFDEFNLQAEQFTFKGNIAVVDEKHRWKPPRTEK